MLVGLENFAAKKHTNFRFKRADTMFKHSEPGCGPSYAGTLKFGQALTWENPGPIKSAECYDS
jgi:hypothetical protein